MNIIGLQLILFFFSVFMTYVMFLHWKRGEISFKTFGGWFLVWMGLVFVAFFPKIFEPLMLELFFVRLMDLGMVIAFIILTYLTIENNIKIKKYEKLLEKIVREVAIKKVKHAK
ncbi:DUF2304 domain-containing protein [Patescibacteria group bacterium]|nr:DUF2304 domain-containing protein [Patescibacteria group bacterium]